MGSEMNSNKATRSSHITYWRRVQRLTLQLLAIWFFVTFGVLFYAKELSTITFFGWPLSFYMGAQGLVLIYVAIVGVYAWSTRQLDNLLAKETSHGR
jgi:putative solute:sodium symporter small subunit